MDGVDDGNDNVSGNCESGSSVSSNPSKSINHGKHDSHHDGIGFR